MFYFHNVLLLVLCNVNVTKNKKAQIFGTVHVAQIWHGGVDHSVYVTY